MAPFWRKREDPEHRRLAERLATLPLFAGIDTGALRALAARLSWQQLPAGAVLFEQGDDASALYLLIYGRLAALRQASGGDWRHVGSVVSGHAVGETGLLVDRPRNARVMALRDSELLRLDRANFEALLAEHPQPMLRLARAALRRYAEDQQQPPLPRCFAILPATPGVDVRGFAGAFSTALGDHESPELVEPAPLDTDAHPGSREEQSARLIYLGSQHDPAWNEYCARQSDVVLYLADATQDVEDSPRLPLPQGHSQIPRLLLLKGADAIRHGSTRQWLDAFPAASQAVHLRHAEDLARLGRRLSGRATGLVLSGGGARGFAHLGALRALREAGHQIDYVGGSSIGAIMGAGIACGWDDDWLREVNHRSFVAGKPVSDWTLPLVSLYGGRRVVKLLREAFGERDIEDLPIPFFCCSSSLTSGRLVVHERGRLWQWLRAASAIPGVLPPVLSGGEVLVDG
ncbi:MAG: patatin-like phospholipase family protein, partial [Xanthomonadales bacterium]|nr:patatin-like phospholipase family protein [Xanthomonadales bacterium]